jgi:hypothetical protein
MATKAIPFPSTKQPAGNSAPEPCQQTNKHAKRTTKAKRTAQAQQAVSNAEPTARHFSAWQERVLALLANGASIAAAMRDVHLSESTFYKTAERHPAFHEAANQARAYHHAQVEDAFHESDSYARALVDRIQRAENLKPHLRLRAALAILNRKPGKWLPSPIPNLAHAPDFPIPQTHSTASDPQSESQAEETSEAKPPQPPAPHNTPGAQTLSDSTQTLDTLDTSDKQSANEILAELQTDQALIEELDALYRSMFPAQTLDTPDNLDNPDKPDTLDSRDNQNTPETKEAHAVTPQPRPTAAQHSAPYLSPRRRWIAAAIRMRSRLLAKRRLASRNAPGIRVQ